MPNYKIRTKRYVRKYTAAERLPVSAAIIDAQRVVDNLCNVPWEQASATTAVVTAHDEKELDANVANRDRFDAAIFCADHSNGQHRAHANAACYRIAFPAVSSGTRLTSLKVRVTSDAYNAAGARIALVTNSTGVIPTDCATCRGEGGIHAAGVAPQTIVTSGGQRYGYPTIKDCVFSVSPGEGEHELPTGGLALGSYLYVFVLMENYNSVRGNWLEGSSVIDNLIEITTDAAIPGWTDGETVDLTVGGAGSASFNVCRGRTLPALAGEVSGMQMAEICLDGSPFLRGRPDLYLRRSSVPAEQSCIGLRTIYGMLYKDQMNQVGAEEYGIENVDRPGASFSLSVRDPLGSSFVGGKTWTQSGQTTGSWRSLAYGNGVFVAGSEDGGLVYSTDNGRTWEQSGQTTGSWRSIAYGNGVFVAGCEEGGIMYSTDKGQTWTQSGQTTGSWRSLAYGNGVFVAGCEDDGIMYSTDDGRSWTQSSQVDGSWRSLAYGNGVFVAGSYGDGVVYSIDNGLTWTRSSLVDGSCYSLAYGNGVFVAGRGGSPVTAGIWWSTDNGRTWSRSDRVSSTWNALAYCNGVFVAASSSVFYSTDNGKTWSMVPHLSGLTWYALAGGDGVFVAGLGNGGGLLYSDHQMESLPSVQSNVWRGLFYSLAYGNGVFVAGNYEDGGLMYSEDNGKTWAQSGQTTRGWASLAYGNGVFVAGGQNGGIMYSTDNGRTWAQSGQTLGSCRSLAYGDRVFVAGFDNSGVMFSTDNGQTWEQGLQTSGSCRSLAYGDGVFVAGFVDSGIMYSTDKGLTWTQSGQTTGSCMALAYGDGVFVAIVGDGIMYSTDKGLTWTQSGQTTGSCRALAYGNGVFVAGGGGLAYSTDNGKTWTQGGQTTGSWQSLAYGNGVFVAGSYSDEGLTVNESLAWMSSKVKLWRIVTSVLFARFAVPIEFPAKKIRLDWTGWEGTATAGGRFNVWLKRDEFAPEYPESIIRNHIIYDAMEKQVDGYELIGSVDATDGSKTAVLDIERALDCTVATILLSSYISMDRMNPSKDFSLPQGVAAMQDVDMSLKEINGMNTGWKPDITLLG